MAASAELEGEVAKIVRKIAAAYEPQRIILFGSHATGNAGPDSDIDLLIIKDTPKRFIERWVEVRRILSDPHRSIPLETLILTPKEVDDRLTMGDQFVAQILRDGKVLYAA